MKTLCRCLSGYLVFLIAGCGSPTPSPVANGPPPPPPVTPAVVQKPVPPPPEKPKPDPFETAMTEVSANLKRYPKLFAGVKDEATADKAVAQVAQLTSRLKELAAEISKLPVKPGQEKYVIALHNDLAQLPTALQANPNMQQVLGDPEIGLKINVAHLTFINEAVQPLAGALMTRQAPSAPSEAEPQLPHASGSPKP